MSTSRHKYRTSLRHRSSSTASVWNRPRSTTLHHSTHNYTPRCQPQLVMTCEYCLVTVCLSVCCCVYVCLSRLLTKTSDSANDDLSVLSHHCLSVCMSVCVHTSVCADVCLCLSVRLCLCTCVCWVFIAVCSAQWTPWDRVRSVSISTVCGLDLTSLPTSDRWRM